MRRMYHIASNWTSEQAKILKQNNIQVEVNGQFTSIELEESTYFSLERYFTKWNISGIFFPEFSKTELNSAPLSALKSTHTHGYPMPDLDFGYRALTYDLSIYCNQCGIGLKQKEPFRIKSEPPTGKKRIFSLGWVYDELFVDRKLYEEVFMPLGTKYMEVLKYGKDIPFENTVQLILPETEEPLNLEGWPTEVCDLCGRRKYQPMAQDFFPMYKNVIVPIFKSDDYFGSGANAFKRIFMAKELREKLISMKIEKPIWFFPAK